MTDTQFTTTGLDVLAKMLQQQVGTPITGDEITFHKDPRIVLPEGTTFEQAHKILKRVEEEQETPTTFERKFRYRFDDGAHATAQVIKAKYGMLLGKAQQTMFGLQPAETKTIATGVGTTMQVPVGLLEIPVFPGLQLYVGETADREYGRVFYLKAMGPRKFKNYMEDLFDAVELYLAGNSIYRGKTIVGSDEPTFLDLSRFDPKQIVFSQDVHRVLDGAVFAPLKHADAFRREGIPLGKKVLLYGPYGTGKTSTGQMTAQVANAHGWTVVIAKTGRDSVEDVIRTARLYAPAVVFYEDIDGAASSSDDKEVARLLEAFDGATSKGAEVMVVLTTNHIERIHKGMLRPGRLDAVVEIAALDRLGVERLIKVAVPAGKLADSVDYDAVAAAMNGYLPAFIRESVNRAKAFAINRLNGAVDYVIDTPDLVDAANSLRPQFDTLDKAGEGERKPTLDTAFDEMVGRQIAEGLRIHGVQIPGAPFGPIVENPEVAAK